MVRCKTNFVNLIPPSSTDESLVFLFMRLTWIAKIPFPNNQQLYNTEFILVVFCRISKVIEMPTILQCFKCWKWISWIWTKIFFMVKDKIRVDFSFCYRCKISQTMLPLNLDCRINIKERRHALVEGNLYHDSLSALLKWYISLYFFSCKIPTS